MSKSKLVNFESKFLSSDFSVDVLFEVLVDILCYVDIVLHHCFTICYVSYHSN